MLAWHGEHLVDIGTKTDGVKLPLADVAEDEGGEQDSLFRLALLASFVNDDFFPHRNPVFKPKVRPAETVKDVLGYCDLAVASYNSDIPSCILRHTWLIFSL